MRIFVDLTDSDIERLDAFCRAQNISQTSLTQKFISELLSNNNVELEKSFGLWAGKQKSVDGVEYEVKIRSEW
jgi:hypothetical protein